VSARLKKPTLDPTDLNSYRPISNLSFISKLVERCVAARFVAHCEHNNLFPSRQPAYRHHHSTHHSTQAAMLIVHSDIIQAVDRGQLMALILLDLSSEFDTVDHDCLLSILCNQFSVDGSAASWFQSHLSERTQTFTARGSQSSPVELQCSVPQAGSDPVHWRMFKTYLTDIGMDLKKQLVRSLFLRDLSWVRSSSLPTWRMFKTYLTDIGSAVISSQMISKSTPTYRPVTRRLAVSGLLTASLNYSQDVRHVVYN